MKHIWLSFFILIFIVKNIQAQKNTDSTKSHEKKYNNIIDEFVVGAQNNMSFVNGMHTLIEKPKSDIDALEKGFEYTTTDGNERVNKTWRILTAKDVEIDKVAYRAVLYDFNKEQRIVLYKPEANGKYFFRIYHSKW